VNGSKHPLATTANDRGRVDAGLLMKRMILLLQPSAQQRAALQKLLDDRNLDRAIPLLIWEINTEKAEQWLPEKQPVVCSLSYRRPLSSGSHAGAVSEGAGYQQCR